MIGEGYVVDGRYRLLERIGAGGMGVVWRALDTLLEREVALKCARVTDERDARRLRREARNAARFHHANIVGVLTFVAEGTVCWIVMEYLPSRSLKQLMTERGRLRPEVAGAIGCQIAEALAVSHRAGVVHGDVTPENILVTADGVAKLTDFGISRAMWTETTQSGGVRGKPRYLPPEVARGKSPDHKADVFSLGASLYAAVEGRSPYGDAEHALAYLSRAAAGRIEPARRCGPLGGPLAAMLMADPRRRPSAAKARLALTEATPPPLHVLSRMGKRRSGLRSRLRPAVPWWRGGPRGAAATGTVTALALIAAVAVLGPWDWGDDDGGAGAKAPAPGPTAALVDAPRADPCALLDPRVLARHGHAELDDDYGEFDRCDVLISEDRGGEEIVDVQLNFSGDRAEFGSGVRTEQIGRVAVSAMPGDAEGCERNLRLADGHEIWISAERLGGSAPDLCAIVRTATGHAVSILNRGAAPQRQAPFTKESLARLDACGMLDAAALGSVKGIAGWRPPDRDFAGWKCDWRSTGDDMEVSVTFSRDNTLADNGRPVVIGGRRARVAPEDHGDDTCVVRTPHRDYASSSGDTTVELVLLAVWGERSPNELCAAAEALSGAAAAKLPKA
ncbi:protein kinase [Streptomyces sp. NPDC020141]|uniref:serine/threonine-protein kinase n=1 Tax=Streptomyces sp. NPDC020141 TaxID=3365065 RepID=UPI0037A06347